MQREATLPELHAALGVLARVIAGNPKGEQVIPLFEDIELEIARRAANDNVKSRALALATQLKRQTAA